MPTGLTYHQTAERPDTRLWVYDDDRTLIDLSTYTITVRVATRTGAVVLTKTSGVTGAEGSGAEPSGTPNITIVWASGELNLNPGVYRVQITASAGSRDRVFALPLTILKSYT